MMRKVIEKVRKKLKGQVTHLAILHIGDLKFNGNLSRMGNATDEEINKAINEILSEMGKTEKDIVDAEAIVERVARDEEFTEEDMKNVRDNILKLVGVDDIVDAFEFFNGTSNKEAIDILESYAKDEVIEEGIDIVLEKGAKFLGVEVGEVTAKGVAFMAKSIGECAYISYHQYEKDKERWKNRAANAIAKRMLNEFYDKVIDKLNSQLSQHAKGWSINIDALAERSITYYGIEGNIEKWWVSMILKKEDIDEDDKDDPSGRYTGIFHIEVFYDMTTFDFGFMEKIKSGCGLDDTIDTPILQSYIIELYKSLEIVPQYIDESSPTKIERTITDDKFSINLLISSQEIDSSSFNDYKEVNINRKIIVSGVKNLPDAAINIENILTYKSSDNDKIKFQYTNNSSVVSKVTIKFGPPNYDNYLNLDSAIWEQWEKEKKLEVWPK